MSQSMKAAAASAACFLLAWLLPVWLFWKSDSLPWDDTTKFIAAALIGYLLHQDREKCLERFYRKNDPEKAPKTQAADPDLKLRGLYRLLTLYIVLALGWNAGHVAATSYLRSRTHIGSSENDLAVAAAVLATVLGGITYAAGRAFFFPYNGPILRGRRVRSGKEARRELSRYLKPGEPEIAWGGMKLPWKAGTQHFLAAGTTGSGKTNLLLQFMASVLVWIGRKPDQRAIVYDPKTELLSFLYGLGLGQKVKILHPLDVRSSAWDLAADVTSPTAAQQMAAVLIPEEKESKHPFFSIASQQLLAGAFTFLMKAAPGNWDLRDAILLMERRELLQQALERNAETAALVEEYFQHHDCFADVRATMANWLRRYRPIAACWHYAKDKVSLEDWISGEYILLLGQDDSIRVQMDAINRALLLRASQLILRGGDSTTRRSWLIIDEVRELGNLEGLSKFLTTARSKGGCFCGGYQTPSGMKAAVGDHIADEINDQIGSWALCRMGGDVSAEWASRFVGDVELEEDTQGTTGPKVVRRRALMPECFKELPLPTPQTGVSAVFITPFTGAYTYTVPGREIAAVRRLIRDDVPNLIRRPRSQQELPPWTDEDYCRLGLTPPEAERDEAPPRRLGVVRTTRRDR